VPANPWSTVFDGYGWVRIDALTGTVDMAPQASTRPDETHSSLVRSVATYGDVDLQLQMRTVRQLRTGSAPNPWETAWALWNYTGNESFYYLILKPNGWELGKADHAYPGAQRFLATGSKAFPVGPLYDVHVRQVGNVLTAWADGQLLTTFTDNERPYRSGAVALYNEDAEVHFENVRITAL
jgi:hypothetical protein